MIHSFSVSAIILRANQVLLVNHRRLGKWIYPGGHLENDEDPVDGLRREIREELGIEIDLLRQPLIQHESVKVLPAPFLMLAFNAGLPPQTRRQVDMVYICRPVGGTPVIEPGELSEYAWVPVDEVATLDVPPELPAVIQAAASHARESGEDGTSAAPLPTEAPSPSGDRPITRNAQHPPR
ncbi:NUDIX domain-containing protein [Micromonospora sp. WMMD956]|uniref:NUDIX hydrolase n=1 Tax=Micromonospora TaxID=1873 RepID=UPI002415BB62|nr:NUDIX domain-containing protein [Micromonospora sp. WMMD956]MDG4814247.1 NUDIX domain-containing protein [Micromonospora sp. WMMD956]